ncbi:MAG: hypothetical protein A2074_06440 [Candidatus Aquicultor primus]|uniref:Uncharacterized protein n=1 Tax=Candidatus Aquicultor primus TaxID=1797195 RepID=A0A1F2UPN9_9ACTN|nr:MAG: hypothetical protein A2074_06440 [Candidatus Aquicultor primus]HCG98477.1 hypothetical protein [Actinomycetota bacterium]
MNNILGKRNYMLRAVILLAVVVAVTSAVVKVDISHSQKMATVAVKQKQEGIASKAMLPGASAKSADKSRDESVKHGKLLIESGNGMSDFGTKVSGAEEALSKIQAKPKLPDVTVAGNPKAVYVLGAPTSDLEGIGFEYDNGIEIYIRPNKHPAPDYNDDVKRFSRVSLVEINGFKGTAADFDKKVLPIIGEVSEVSAVVWYEEDGTEYHIYGDRDGRIRLKDLLPIAHSMR